MRVIGEGDEPGVANGEPYVRDAGSANYLDGILSQYSVHTMEGGVERTRAFAFTLADAVLIAGAFEVTPNTKLTGAARAED